MKQILLRYKNSEQKIAVYESSRTNLKFTINHDSILITDLVSLSTAPSIDLAKEKDVAPKSELAKEKDVMRIVENVETAQVTEHTQDVEDVEDVEILFEIESKKTWGVPTWTSMHIHAAHYSNTPTNEEKNNTLNWFTFTLKTIPCIICRTDALKWFDEHSIVPYLKNSYTLSIYVLKFHNHVNFKLKKREWTLEEMCENIGIETIINPDL